MTTLDARVRPGCRRMITRMLAGQRLPTFTHVDWVSVDDVKSPPFRAVRLIA